MKSPSQREILYVDGGGMFSVEELRLLGRQWDPEASPGEELQTGEDLVEQLIALKMLTLAYKLRLSLKAQAENDARGKKLARRALQYCRPKRELENLDRLAAQLHEVAS